MTPKILTKSKYLDGLQCPKYLWFAFRAPNEIPKPDADTLHRFEEGHQVGRLAKKLFPDGVDIPTEDSNGKHAFLLNIRKTKEMLERYKNGQRKTLFEAGISVGRIFSRIDILKPAKKGEWDIIEVKSTTEVKDKPIEHIDDVAFQKHCCDKYGLKIRKCYLMHVNNQYVKHGKIEPKRFLKKEDITADVDKAVVGIEKKVEDMFEVIAAEKCHGVAIGKQCDDPYYCPLKEQCWGFLPENSVFALRGGWKKSLDLFEKGIYAIKDIPDGFKLNEEQGIQRKCEKTGKPHIQKEDIKRFLKSLHYPLYFLDFETINPAVPMFDGTKPYQMITFQFSLHVVSEENSEAEHFSFLADSKEDPRPEFLSELKKVLGDNGSIIVFHQGFEISRLKELAEAFPEYKEWIESVLERIEDLIIPFKKFYYYHPKQGGSASLKNVLPALTGKGYEGLEIPSGGDAGIAFLELTDNHTSGRPRKKLIENLEEYCGLDTEGMIWIVEKLRELVRE